MPVKNRSIAGRLTFGLILTVGVVSIFVVGLIYMYEVRKAKAELERKADEILAYHVGALEIPLWNIDYGQINIIGKTISQIEPVAGIVIKDAFDRVAYSLEKPDIRGSMQRSSPIYHKEIYVGTVSISLTRQFYEHDNRDLLFSFFLLILIILATISVFSGALIRLILKRPLDSLNRVVEAYTFKNYENSLQYYRPYIEFQPFSLVLAEMGRRITEQLLELRKAEEKYRNIFENAIEGIFQSTPHGQFININPAMAQMMGYGSPAEVLHSPFNISRDFYVRPEDRKRFVRILRENGRVFEFETPLYRKDKTQFIVSLSARSVRDDEGNLRYYEGFMRDITEEKRLRKEAEYRLQQVIHADKLASLGEVVAGVAHEINNPNSFITCNAPLLEETWQVIKPILDDHETRNPEWRHQNMTMTELSDDMEEIIQAITIGSERINRIVVNLKDFIRIDNSLDTTSVDLNQVIEKAFTIIGTQVRKSVKTTVMDLGDHIPQLQGYFHKLEQIVMNLVINGVHAVSAKTDGKITIRTRYLSRCRGILLQVEDNGVGMSSEVLERIYEPFYTTRRNSGGTGLGLSVSYNLVKEHNGIIGVLSKPGVGTRFSLCFPVDPKETPDLSPLVPYLGEDGEVIKTLESYFDQSVDTQEMFATAQPEELIRQLKTEPEVDMVILSQALLNKSQWSLDRIREEFPLLTVILYADTSEFNGDGPCAVAEPDHLMHQPFDLKEFETIIRKTERLKL